MGDVSAVALRKMKCCDNLSVLTNGHVKKAHCLLWKPLWGVLPPLMRYNFVFRTHCMCNTFYVRRCTSTTALLVAHAAALEATPSTETYHISQVHTDHYLPSPPLLHTAVPQSTSQGSLRIVFSALHSACLSAALTLYVAHHEIVSGVPDGESSTRAKADSTLIIG